IRFLLPAGVTLDQLPVAAQDAGDGAVVITTPTPTATLRILTTWAVDHGGELVQLSVNRPSLDDIYVELTASNDVESP
ncbi:MAG: type transport system ATP-binding protein, partial [Ilumatobacteraceae bacterium]